jgi:hypothetical protein
MGIQGDRKFQEFYARENKESLKGMKEKYNTEIACSAEMISRFMDNELHGDDLATVRRHVESCKSCRERLTLMA